MRSKILAISVVILVFCLIASWTVYGLFGHRLIEAMYKGESIAILNSFMKGRTSTSLEDYYAEASRIMWIISFRIVIAYIVVAILVYLGLFKKVTYFIL